MAFRDRRVRLANPATTVHQVLKDIAVLTAGLATEACPGTKESSVRKAIKVSVALSACLERSACQETKATRDQPVRLATTAPRDRRAPPAYPANRVRTEGPAPMGRWVRLDLLGRKASLVSQECPDRVAQPARLDLLAQQYPV